MFTSSRSSRCWQQISLVFVREDLVPRLYFCPPPLSPKKIWCLVRHILLVRSCDVGSELNTQPIHLTAPIHIPHHSRGPRGVGDTVLYIMYTCSCSLEHTRIRLLGGRSSNGPIPANRDLSVGTGHCQSSCCEPIPLLWQGPWDPQTVEGSRRAARPHTFSLLLQIHANVSVD